MEVCKYCGRKLKTANSKERGCGKVCFDKNNTDKSLKNKIKHRWSLL